MSTLCVLPSDVPVVDYLGPILTPAGAARAGGATRGLRQRRSSACVSHPRERDAASRGTQG